MKKLSREKESRFDVREDPLFYDEQTKILGSPGYRNMAGKSGLGYIESAAEEARFEGQCLRWIFTGKFITHNPIYLSVFFFFGLLFGVLPLAVIVDNFFSTGTLQSLFFLIPVLPYTAGGLALLVNVWRSISNPHGFSITGD